MHPEDNGRTRPKSHPRAKAKPHPGWSSQVGPLPPDGPPGSGTFGGALPPFWRFQGIPPEAPRSAPEHGETRPGRPYH